MPKTDEPKTDERMVKAAEKRLTEIAGEMFESNITLFNDSKQYDLHKQATDLIAETCCAATGFTPTSALDPTPLATVEVAARLTAHWQEAEREAADTADPSVYVDPDEYLALCEAAYGAEAEETLAAAEDAAAIRA